jgi:hypothetical protein
MRTFLFTEPLRYSYFHLQLEQHAARTRSAVTSNLETTLLQVLQTNTANTWTHFHLILCQTRTNFKLEMVVGVVPGSLPKVVYQSKWQLFLSLSLNVVFVKVGMCSWNSTWMETVKSERKVEGLWGFLAGGSAGQEASGKFQVVFLFIVELILLSSFRYILTPQRYVMT